MRLLTEPRSIPATFTTPAAAATQVRLTSTPAPGSTSGPTVYELVGSDDSSNLVRTVRGTLDDAVKAASKASWIVGSQRMGLAYGVFQAEEGAFTLRPLRTVTGEWPFLDFFPRKVFFQPGETVRADRVDPTLLAVVGGAVRLRFDGSGSTSYTYPDPATPPPAS